MSKPPTASRRSPSRAATMLALAVIGLGMLASSCSRGPSFHYDPRARRYLRASSLVHWALQVYSEDEELLEDVGALVLGDLYITYRRRNFDRLDREARLEAARRGGTHVFRIDHSVEVTGSSTRAYVGRSYLGVVARSSTSVRRNTTAHYLVIRVRESVWPELPRDLRPDLHQPRPQGLVERLRSSR